MSIEWMKSIDRRLSEFQETVQKRFDGQDEKFNQLLIKDAHRTGKIIGAVAVLSAVVSILVSVITSYAK